jgi:hypothetical protein
MQRSYWIAEILSLILMPVLELCWTDLCISLRGFCWNLETEGKIKLKLLTCIVRGVILFVHCIYCVVLQNFVRLDLKFCVGDVMRFCSMHVVDAAWSALGLCLFILFTGDNEHYFYSWVIFLLTHNKNKLLFLRQRVKCVLLLGVHNHM